MEFHRLVRYRSVDCLLGFQKVLDSCVALGVCVCCCDEESTSKLCWLLDFATVIRIVSHRFEIDLSKNYCDIYRYSISFMTCILMQKLGFYTGSKFLFYLPTIVMGHKDSSSSSSIFVYISPACIFVYTSQPASLYSKMMSSCCFLICKFLLLYLSRKWIHFMGKLLFGYGTNFGPSLFAVPDKVLCVFDFPLISHCW